MMGTLKTKEKIIMMMNISVYKSINIEKISIQHHHLNKIERNGKNDFYLSINSSKVQNQSKFNMFMRKLFSLDYKDVKICETSKCEFCCLGRHQCGSKAKCDYYK